jgi:predicted PurR-regulated permease PerM
MEKKTFSFHRLAFLFIIIVLGYVILDKGKFILGPLTFSILFTIMLQPISDFFEKLVKHKIPAILLTILSVTIGLGIIITLFSMQITNIIENLPDITGKINQGLEKIFNWVNENLNLNKSDLWDSIPQLADSSISFLQKGISFSTTFIFNLFITVLFVFFMLWYKRNFYNFILIQSTKTKRDELKDILHKIQTTIQKYLYGLLMVIGILAVLNSVGLLIIGVDYAVFWGILAAFLAVIPYIGTTLGGTLPFLYALATSNNWWQPAAVVGMYVIIQQIEGNIITPNVIGNSVSINPLVALLSIIVGGFVWGIAGIILAIPAIAIVKIVLEHNNRTKPLAFLLSNKIHKSNNSFWEEMDNDKYRMK